MNTRSLRPLSLEDVPHDLDPRLKTLLESIISTVDLREGRVAKDSNARFASLEDLVVAESVYTARTGITAVIPFDNTIPQNTEGVEILVATVRPKASRNRLRIEFEIWGTAVGAVLGVVGALFEGAGANAIYTSALTLGDGWVGTVVGRHELQAGNAESLTFKLRVGVSNNTFYTNGGSVNPHFGVIPQACRLRIIELPGAL